MNVLRFKDHPLSSKAEQLVQFDVDSIRQVVAARHGQAPQFWLADPDQYERNGRLLRDSSTPRLLAYAADSRTVYVTDGCNSCVHEVGVDLKTLSADQLLRFAERNKIPFELLENLAAHCAE